MDPSAVHGALSRHLLVDGYRLVLDLDRSAGSWLVDARNGRRYLDFYTFFASSPLGMNPFADDPEFLESLGRVAANKPANSDLYTVELAEFVAAFQRVLGDPELPHLFFVEGGALAVENALKCAFDWKSRWNEAHGRHPGLGTRVLHLTRAFHGRSGYTLSLTNTDPVKTDRFPKFGWPRIDVPAIHFGDVERAEERALAQARERSRDSVMTSPASSPSRSRVRAATTTCAPSSSRRCRRSAMRTMPCSFSTRSRPGSA